MSVREAIKSVRKAAGAKVGPIERDAFLYMDPRPPDNQFAQCGTCYWYQTPGCGLFTEDVKILANYACGLYVNSIRKYDGSYLDAVTPEEAGVVKNEVRCENCLYFNKTCGLYDKLNKQMPEYFDLDAEVDPKGCCNAWEKKR